MFDQRLRDGVLQLSREQTCWLSTGWNGGTWEAGAVYNITVPEGWPEQDLAAYATARKERAGFEADGPTLFTGVSQRHARGARLDSVVAYATAGISNPAALPVPPSPESSESAVNSGRDGNRCDEDTGEWVADDREVETAGSEAGPGTVNVIVGTDRALSPGGRANLVAVAAEAKATTLLAATGFPGTTTDAIVVGDDPSGEHAAFTGSATAVGAAARVCVRDAVLASLRSRYAAEPMPEKVDGAEHGVRADQQAAVFELDGADEQ